ncbi:hypothetical protein Sjap_006888 [Stephania japonica]|uniref:Uncharacterized protein n=1 Tax=Stephania japonica TaxID=461633 RepID=A0AAP0K9B4_9MAGN
MLIKDEMCVSKSSFNKTNGESFRLLTPNLFVMIPTPLKCFPLAYFWLFHSCFSPFSYSKPVAPARHINEHFSR